MNIEASSIPASPVSQPDISHVAAPLLGISHHVTEDLVPVPTPVDTNAPPALDIATSPKIICRLALQREDPLVRY